MSYHPHKILEKLDEVTEAYKNYRFKDSADSKKNYETSLKTLKRMLEDYKKGRIPKFKDPEQHKMILDFGKNIDSLEEMIEIEYEFMNLELDQLDFQF